MKPNAASQVVIDCALRVHTSLGAGVFESAICAWLLYEFHSAGLHLGGSVPRIGDPLRVQATQLP